MLWCAPDCWGHGIWNMPSNPQDNQGIGRGTPTENYEPVKATNADALVWGNLLIQADHAGVIRQGGPVNSATHSVAPGPGQAIEAMDDKLLAGVFTSEGKKGGYLMVVDLRTAMSEDDAASVQPRTVTLKLAASCTATVVPGGADGWAAMLPHPEPEAQGQQQSVRLTLSGGGGALLRVEGCGELLRQARQWWMDPRQINLRHNYPEASPKATTYDVWGSAARHTSPGGLHPVGHESNFLIGGSAWESGNGWGRAPVVRKLGAPGRRIGPRRRRESGL